MGVPAVMTLTLRMRQGDGPAAQTVERKLERGRIVLGRGAESDWVLTDPERTISKRHCVIEQMEHGYEITDLSTNGVFLNDEDEPIGIGNTPPAPPRRSDSDRQLFDQGSCNGRIEQIIS